MDEDSDPLIVRAIELGALAGSFSYWARVAPELAEEMHRVAAQHRRMCTLALSLMVLERGE